MELLPCMVISSPCPKSSERSYLPVPAYPLLELPVASWNSRGRMKFWHSRTSVFLPMVQTPALYLIKYFEYRCLCRDGNTHLQVFFEHLDITDTFLGPGNASPKWYNQNARPVKKTTDSSYVLEVRSSGLATGFDVGIRKREKVSQVCDLSN